MRSIGRYFSRIRWITKAKVLGRHHVSIRRQPRIWLRYVVFDPELDNFSYDLENEDDLAAAVAAVVGDTSTEEVRSLFDELHRDHALADELLRRRRWRPDAKRTVAFGRRVAWYALARLLKPGLIVETGIKDGLGSVVLLRALERNAAEGADGRLVSFDLSADRGWLVGPNLRERWEPVFVSTQTALEPTLVGRRVGLIIHDSEPTYACAAHEFSVAIAHADDRLAMVSNGDWSEALRDVARETGAEYATVRERPHHAFYPGARVDLAVLDATWSTAARAERSDRGS